ncbi:MAG: hypothetical protein ABSD48_00275 [Armatimonadota bacterium]
MRYLFPGYYYVNYYPPTRRERAEAAQLRPAARGTYTDGTPRDYRQGLVLLLLFWSLVPVGGISALCQAVMSPPGAMLSQVGTDRSWHLTTRAELALLGVGGIGIAILVPILLWPSVVRWPAQSVVWDERGLQVTKCYGGPIALRWEELLGLTQFMSNGWNPRRVVVAARGYRSFSIHGKGSGYDELVDALKAHIWTRDEDGAGEAPVSTFGSGPSSGEAMAPSQQQPECKWCGETFPVGTTTCPLCGRPLSVENSI